MLKQLTVGLIVVVVSMAARFASAVILPPGKRVTLSWNYSQISPEIVFNVYASTNLAAPARNWTLLTNVTALSCALPAVSPNQFFTVTASNTVTGRESGR
jgi:hypothetical protein